MASEGERDMLGVTGDSSSPRLIVEVVNSMKFIDHFFNVASLLGIPEPKFGSAFRRLRVVAPFTPRGPPNHAENL